MSCSTAPGSPPRRSSRCSGSYLACPWRTGGDAAGAASVSAAGSWPEYRSRPSVGESELYYGAIESSVKHRSFGFIAIGYRLEADLAFLCWP